MLEAAAPHGEGRVDGQDQELLLLLTELQVTALRQPWLNLQVSPSL